MQDTIKGTVLPVLEIVLEAGETVQSEIGEFSWMSDGVQMSTNTGGGTGGKGLMGALKRVAGGGSFLFNNFTTTGGSGMVAFAAKVPGKIIPIDISPGNEYICHRHGFLAGIPGIQIAAALQQTFKGGIFGGEGFVLQHLSGTGKAWIELSGEVLQYDLAPGQIMRAHPGHVGLFDASVSFTVEKVPGVANRWLGSDGHHFVVLTGPGRVFLQSMTLPILAGAISQYLPQQTTSGAVEGGAVGGVLGGLLRG